MEDAWTDSGSNSTFAFVPLEEAATRPSSDIRVTFLAAACFIQLLLGRRYIVESCAYSDIYDKSPLAILRAFEIQLAL